MQPYHKVNTHVKLPAGRCSFDEWTEPSG